MTTCLIYSNSSLLTMNRLYRYLFSYSANQNQKQSHDDLKIHIEVRQSKSARMTMLYTTLIKPLTEYAGIACPQQLLPTLSSLNASMDELKWGRLHNCRYPARLSALGLQTITDWKKRGDWIQMFKHFSILLSTQPHHCLVKPTHRPHRKRCVC